MNLRLQVERFKEMNSTATSEQELDSWYNLVPSALLLALMIQFLIPLHSMYSGTSTVSEYPQQVASTGQEY
jgi:hypothetical protein